MLGLPPGILLSDALHELKSYDSDEVFDLTGWDISDLHVAQVERRDEQFRVSLVVVWRSKSNDAVEVSLTDLDVRLHDKPPSGTDAVMEARTEGAKSSREAARKPEGGGAPPQSSVSPDASVRHPSAAASIQRAEATAERFVAGSPATAERQASPPLPSATPQRPPTDTVSFVERAKALIGRGDISGARLFLERARARNEPNATYLLAQTWDPEMLRKWNVRGLRPDPERARALYAEAAERGPVDDRSLSVMHR